MLAYLIRRLLLLPATLFCIILVNFAIINLAPGDPVTISGLSPGGEATRHTDRAMAFGSDERYLQFREHYGLTLPIFFNSWPFLDQTDVRGDLQLLEKRRPHANDPKALPVKAYDKIRITFGDQARYIMPELLAVILDPAETLAMRSLAAQFFVRGGTRQAYIGPTLTPEERTYNAKSAAATQFLRQQLFKSSTSAAKVVEKSAALADWYFANRSDYRFEPTLKEKIAIFFLETRFFRYMSRVLTLDFGTLRNDSNRTVVSEASKRFKYSITLAILPMMLTFGLCQLFAMAMALRKGRALDYSLNLLFLVLYAIPIFVAVPFLMEQAIDWHTFPFSDITIPISGFTSAETIYESQNTLQRLGDTIAHLVLPVTAIMYGSLAAQTRLSRTAILEVLGQDYVRTAWAKGVPTATLLWKHVGRNAAITIVTSIAGSLGIVLGGSLIVETLFEINGFGKFFYDAVVNRDYNVIMFSALAGSFLTLTGYLVADIAYTLLDPRVTLD